MALPGRSAFARRLAVAVAIGSLAVPFSGAQDGMVVPSSPGHPYTLHVYANRVQVATLVLNQRQEIETGLQAGAFTIRLDEGPKFHPLQARVQGDDPLSLAVLIHATGAVNPALIAAFTKAFVAVAGESLTARDRVSVYAADCALLRATQIALPADERTLQTAFAGVLENKTLHGELKPEGGCDKSRRLWDWVSVAARQIQSLPGRRVMIVLTDGQDDGSVNSWNRVSEYLNSVSISLFGLRTGEPLSGIRSAGKAEGAAVRARVEDPFVLLSEGTGGLVLPADQTTLGAALERMIRLIRARYILEFQRPRNSVSGVHFMDVRVPDRKAVVLPGGVGVKLEDPTIAADPSTVPSDQTHAPLLGERHGLTVPR
jgi:hypothetical protein